MTEHKDVDRPKITVEKRWLAARRLAAGDDIVIAAARSGLHEETLMAMLDEDEGFTELIEAARERDASGLKEDAAHWKGFVGDVFEDALASRNVSTLNMALRVSGLLKRSSGAKDGGSETGGGSVNPEMRFLAELPHQEMCDYLWAVARAGVPASRREAVPVNPPQDFKNRIGSLFNLIDAFDQPEAANDNEQEEGE